MAGKGSAPRKGANQKAYEENWEKIFKKSQPQANQCPAGLTIESGWADRERLEQLKKDQAQDRRNG